MKTYIYKVTRSSASRGHNLTVEVYRVKNNKPIYLGCNDKINTAAYKGERPCAAQLIADIEGFKFEGYNLTSKNIQLFEV